MTELKQFSTWPKLYRYAEELEQRVRELEADPDRPTVTYAGNELEVCEEKLQKAEAVVEAARRAMKAPPGEDFDELEAALTAYDESPTQNMTVHWNEHGHIKHGPAFEK